MKKITVITTVWLSKEQHNLIKNAAIGKRKATGTGRPSLGRVIRDLIELHRQDLLADAQLSKTQEN